MPTQTETGWTARRRHMVETQLVARGIADPRALDAMASIPREEFVSERERIRAYLDEPVSIGYGQTLSQPYMTALMVECLGLGPRDRVLEVGGGCGYHAAVLGQLAGEVITIELVPELAALARENLRRTGFGSNVEVVCGDGSVGWEERAPYDAISVACAAPEVPEALLAQLAPEGRLVIPVGSREEQDLRLVRKHGSALSSRTVTYCRFVPLLGREGWRC